MRIPMPFTAAAFLAMGLGLGCPEPTACQETRPSRYVPQRSTLSPYLNYFVNPNPGVLDRYNAFVRPAIELQQVLVQQNVRIQELGGQVREVRAPTAGSTGIGGAFQNYSHYYSAPRAAVRR